MRTRLALLETLAGRLNPTRIPYAIGSSALLYARGLVDGFRDIDLFINEEDGPAVLQALDGLGAVERGRQCPPYVSPLFSTITAPACGVDIIGGFGVLQDATEYAIRIGAHSIEQDSLCGAQPVPLMYLEDCLVFYQLMGRRDKVALLRDHFRRHQAGPDHILRIQRPGKGWRP